ncbi:MAG TPA: GyrI-like domain-containing protein [Actinophytocola sp.]|jgi:hypothetical protein|uniref:GyrI-like domain-containing protein n=1 Tax=Actinophytocola sp. TaxID=1872138 RepID=UPI002E028314|nr:GyrI-like domain-containing protein [Actinophytocola sp.]
MTVQDVLPALLYRARQRRIDLVDVPELGYLMIRGRGAPEDPEFGAAVQALYAVSYGAHFELRKRNGWAPRMTPLEALWWVDDPDLADTMAAIVRGETIAVDTDRACWRWQAMIVQPEPLDARTVTDAVARVRSAKDLPAVDRLRYERWTEGRCAQLLHVGPYVTEWPSIVRLHQEIAALDYRPHGRHHEIYLNDPCRTEPERLRTILRQPIEPVPVQEGLR